MSPAADFPIPDQAGWIPEQWIDIDAGVLACMSSVDPRKNMPKMRKKSDLPTKICVVCGLPFAWRRKWARDWDKVTHCSDHCRAAAGTRAHKVRP